MTEAHTFQGSVNLFLVIEESIVHDMGEYPTKEMAWETAAQLYCMNGERYQVRSPEGDTLYDTDSLFVEKDCDEDYVLEEDQFEEGEEIEYIVDEFRDAAE